MKILPNSTQRYLASLRRFVSFSIEKHGIGKQHYKNLKKIYLCEAILNKNSLKSIDINKLTNNILNAAANFNYDTKFKTNIRGNLFINKELYSSLLLEIFKKHPLKVFQQNDLLCLKFSGKIKNLSTVISALNGYILHETKTDQNIIVIPTKKTNQPSVYIESEWEFLFDSYSIVNLIFKT